MRVERYTPAYQRQLCALVNLHLGAVAPGWSLSGDDLARHFVRDETETVVDPWVAARITLCIADEYEMQAVAHLLHHADRTGVGEMFRGVGEVAWFLALPAHPDAATAILDAARTQFGVWGATRESGWGAGLPAGPFGGVPDVWPHIAAALAGAGYRPGDAHREALYGGTLAGIGAPGRPPLTGMTLARAVGRFGVRFSARLGGREVGHCELLTDLTNGGATPAPHGWAELQEIEVREEWRNRGIGGWLVRHAAAWLRLAGAARIVLAVADENAAAGADRFYRRFGWDLYTRTTRVWGREQG